MMNVFEFLGLPAGHRPSGKVVQLVKHFDEVPEKKVKFPMTAQVKKDGVFGMLVVLGRQARVFGRTGKLLSTCEGYVDPTRLEDGVYIGEVCLPGKSLEVLSGIVNPNRTKPVDSDLLDYWFANREFWFHDHLHLKEFVSGQSPRKYNDRLRSVILSGLPAVRTGTVHSASAAEDFARHCIESGEEGAVFKQDADWVAGHKGWRSMKRVRRIEYDLICTGYEEGKGKYTGKVANLLFRWKEGEIKAMLGKNYTHEDAEGMLKAILGDAGASPGNPLGCIFTVYGLQDSSKGKIRLPKVGELRHDKNAPDF